MYGAYRPGREGTNYWRIAGFLFPFYVMIPTGVLGVRVGVRAWVPIDDEHTMHYSIWHTLNGKPIDEQRQRDFGRFGLRE